MIIIIRNKKHTAYIIFESLLSVAIILNCRSVWMSLTSTKEWFDFLVFLLLIFSSAGCILTSNRLNIKRFSRVCTYSSFVIIFIAFFYMVNPYNGRALFKFGCSIIALLMVCTICYSRDRVPDVIYIYKRLVLFIALISSFMWVLCSLMKVISPTNNVYTTWTGTGNAKPMTSFYNIYFEYQYTIAPVIGLVARNISIFAEAPMASLHFSIALMIELFLEKTSSKWRILLLTIAIITTFSTTGYILIVLSLGIKIIRSNSKNKILYFFKLTFVPICIISAFLFVDTALSNKLITSSGQIRHDDFLVGYRAWIDNMVMGAGFNNNDSLQSYMGSWRSTNVGFSNSPMRVLADGGIYFAIPYIICFASGLKNAVMIRDKDNLFFIILFIYLFIITIFPYQYLTIFFLIYFIHYKGCCPERK